MLERITRPVGEVQRPHPPAMAPTTKGRRSRAHKVGEDGYTTPARRSATCRAWPMGPDRRRCTCTGFGSLLDEPARITLGGPPSFRNGPEGPEFGKGVSSDRVRVSTHNDRRPKAMNRTITSAGVCVMLAMGASAAQAQVGPNFDPADWDYGPRWGRGRRDPDLEPRMQKIKNGSRLSEARSAPRIPGPTVPRRRPVTTSPGSRCSMSR